MKPVYTVHIHCMALVYANHRFFTRGCRSRVASTCSVRLLMNRTSCHPCMKRAPPVWTGPCYDGCSGWISVQFLLDDVLVDLLLEPGDGRLDLVGQVADQEGRRLVGLADLDLDLAFLEAPVADRDPYRKGSPMRSASANLTPADSFLSSYSTSMPAFWRLS